MQCHAETLAARRSLTALPHVSNPIAIYTSELIKWVKERVLGVEGLSFVHDVGWVTTGGDVSQFVNTVQASVRASIDKADKYRLAFDYNNRRGTIYAQTRPPKHLWLKLTAKTTVGDDFVKFNKEGTRWLRVRIDAHLTFKEHHNRCMKARAAKPCFGALTKLMESYKRV